MKDAKYFLIVKFSIQPRGVQEVLAWLDGGHAAEVLKQPGFLWCKRLKLDGEGSYMIMYGIESQAAFLAYENNAPLKKKFMAERAPFERHLRIERFHGEAELSL